MNGFYVHLVDAIIVNKRRRIQYAERTGGRTRRLSSFLIWFERLTLPLAWWIDRRARPFNARGIPIVESDFVSMELIRAADAPPRYRKVAPESAFQEVRAGLDRIRAAARAAIPVDDYRAVAHAAHAFLEEIKAIEARVESHFCMTRHFVESLGIASANATDYSARTGGEINAFVRFFLDTQIFGLRFVEYFDRRAQPFHAEGVGIVLNDIPDIPFDAAYERMKERDAVKAAPSGAAPAATPLGTAAPRA